MYDVQKIVATGFLLVGDEVLIIKRSMKERFFPGVFEMPSGKIDFGEDAQMGLKREFKEETNLNIEVFEPFYVFSYVTGLQDGSKRHTVEIVFRVGLKSSKDDLKLSKDHDDFRWIKKSDINNKITLTGEIGKAIKKGFELYHKSDS